MKSSLTSTTLLFSVAIAILFLLNACIKGDGPVVQETLIVEPFTGIDLKGSFDVVVTLGSQQAVLAEGQQNIIDRIITRVNSDGVLELELERGNYKEFQLKIYITIPAASYFAISGSGDMLITKGENQVFDDLQLLISGSGNMSGVGEFSVNNSTIAEIRGSGNMNFDLFTALLDAKISGSGKMLFDVIGNEIDATISGSGDMLCTGLAPTQNILVSGSGDYKAFFVDSQNTTAEVSGSGVVECKVSSQLNATISGSGKIFYKGTPVVNSTVSGSGALINAN